MPTLEQLLSERTKEAVLYEKLPDRVVRCFACGHRCLIREGRPGICRVRFNREGVLYAPTGYVGALQCDPIEKKPFFHAYPGALAFSFGMLGCDLHCSYCFAPGTRILTDLGHVPIDSIHANACAANGWVAESAVVEGPVAVVTHRGASRRAVRAFRHGFQGELVRVRPACLPPIESTPDHPYLAVRRPSRGDPPEAPVLLPAGRLTRDYLLVVPRRFEFSESVTLETADLLAPFETPFTVRHRIGAPTLRRILRLSEAGVTSGEIGRRLGLDASHVRHLRSRVARGEWDVERLEMRSACVVREGTQVRFAKERRPGVPASLPLDPRFARLLGLYCAEGSVARSAGRRHAATVVFSFGRHERRLAQQTLDLLRQTLGVRPRLQLRRTTLCVDTSKASGALLFKSLCGTGSKRKRVPPQLFGAHREVVQAFLDGYVVGDGWTDKSGRVTISTVSEEMAAGIAGLVLKLGVLPQWYRYRQARRRTIQGRRVRQSGTVHIVRWHPQRRSPSNVIQTPDSFLVPIRSIDRRAYDGPVYNIEVANDHTYLANGIAVHNCQNWFTSQALRDPASIAPPQDVTPKALASMAVQQGAAVMVSTYNEPLITSEWAVDVFREAKAAGIVCGYVSNGNATEQVLDYLRPWADLYKVDLKGFTEKGYRELGGVLKNVLDSIALIHKKGFWIEIVTLVVPGFNDGEEELRSIARFLRDISPDIPWHVTAFHSDYKMQEKDDTPTRSIVRGARIGIEEGLRFVYAGNRPGQVGDLENTYCPDCKELLIERFGFYVRANRLVDGACPKCARPIPGRWSLPDGRPWRIGDGRIRAMR